MTDLTLLGSGYKKAPMYQDFRGFCQIFWGLSLGNFTSLDRLNGNPHALDLTAWQFDSDALNVRTKFPPCVLN